MVTSKCLFSFSLSLCVIFTLLYVPIGPNFAQYSRRASVTTTFCSVANHKYSRIFFVFQSNRTCPICRGNASEYLGCSSEERWTWLSRHSFLIPTPQNTCTAHLKKKRRRRKEANLQWKKHAKTWKIWKKQFKKRQKSSLNEENRQAFKGKENVIKITKTKPKPS